jgi:hypothetical protein
VRGAAGSEVRTTTGDVPAAATSTANVSTRAEVPTITADGAVVTVVTVTEDVTAVALGPVVLVAEDVRAADDGKGADSGPDARVHSFLFLDDDPITPMTTDHMAAGRLLGANTPLILCHGTVKASVLLSGKRLDYRLTGH